MVSDRLITLVVFIQERKNKQKLILLVEKYLKLLKQNFDYYELILVTERSSQFFNGFSNGILNDFKNVCIINPIAKIDVDIALTLGLVNSIGDRAVCCTEDSDFNLVKGLVTSEEKSNVFVRSKINESLNIFLIQRATINALVSLFGNVRIKLLERTLLNTGYPFIIFREVVSSHIGIKTRILKKLRILYNEKFVVAIAIMLTNLVVFGIAKVCIKSSYAAFIDLLSLLIVSFIILLFSKKMVDLELNNSTVNYKIHRSDFTDIKKLNVLK